MATPPESDGSTYTWAGAAMLTVDIKPWGGGYVRSDPYLIDCPVACIRSFDQNREVKLTAYHHSRAHLQGLGRRMRRSGESLHAQVERGSDRRGGDLQGQFVPPAPPAPAEAGIASRVGQPVR